MYFVLCNVVCSPKVRHGLQSVIPHKVQSTNLKQFKPHLTVVNRVLWKMNYIRNALVGDIDVDDMPLHRELLAAVRMKRLMKRYPPGKAVALALLLRGADRIVKWEDAVLLAVMIRRLGPDRAFKHALEHGMFLHMDRPLLPGSSFDLNLLSDADCRSRFRFDHNGIKRLVMLMAIPDVVIVLPHRDRISGLEGMMIVWLMMLT